MKGVILAAFVLVPGLAWGQSQTPTQQLNSEVEKLIPIETMVGTAFGCNRRDTEWGANAQRAISNTIADDAEAIWGTQPVGTPTPRDEDLALIQAGRSLQAGFDVELDRTQRDSAQECATPDPNDPVTPTINGWMAQADDFAQEYASGKWGD